jgi:multicomponent K+:H+ antiporter subunit E
MNRGFAMLRRFLPHPVLSFVLVAVWVLLFNEISAASIVSGVVLGLVIPLFTRQFWPEAPRIRKPLVIAEYVLIVLYDIVVSNILVAYLILFRRARSLRPRFFAVPLDVRTPEAITVLAGTITMTPGTVSSDLSADGRYLLVHGLDVGDEAETVATIKRRYERRLREMFE